MFFFRYHPISTLFNLPEVCLYCDMVEFLENEASFATAFSFINLFTDVRAAMDYVHLQGTLKQKTLDNLPKYVLRTEKLATLLDRIREAGKLTFLITNSDYPYTDRVLSYLLNGMLPDYPSWRDYFGKKEKKKDFSPYIFLG